MEVHVPLNVSGVWYPIYDKDIARSGSIGLSITLEPKIIVSGKISQEPRVYVVEKGERENRLELKAFENLSVLKRLGSLEIEVHTEVPLGYGYGMSGAISLGYSVLAYEMGLTSLKEALLTAHESDVVSKNGLGDVISEYYGGGIIYRKKPGAPTIGEIEVFDVSDHTPLCSLPQDHLPTSVLLKDNTNALRYISQFLSDPTLRSFFTVAKMFTEELGFFSPFEHSFKKKGLILKYGECEAQWIAHKIAKSGVSVH
ncbi:GHMP kinase [Stygiolobus caldivivus]|uniref:Pantoate kinase n=1 Tax=Stygiolobus caldivivus TaxID=2824673 RepID=A0A8D5U4Y1_9CREN|nr:GHMP kinase [Stygiolobus caldivivus]BCU69550.1 GHMP kinase [Stygiolobus caldivivus]